MTLYNVHLFREMRLRFDDIEAGSHEEAAAIAGAKPDREAVSIDDCDGANIAALVDVVGDDECEHSRTIDLPHVESTAPKILAALEHINRSCQPGIDQSDNDLENFIGNVRDLSAAAIREARGQA